MSQRRENREAAVQFLYQWATNPGDHLPEALREFFERQDFREEEGERPPLLPRDYFSFAEELIVGTLGAEEAIDATIREYTRNWDFRRISRIDLAILRLAIFEMAYRPDIPPIVSINEAIDLSKRFSIPEAKRFINGILDQYKLTLQRPLREAAGEKL